MIYFFIALIFILGLIVGSFLSAFTYRLPRRIELVFARSFCPQCKKKIAWYDNIPLFSYLNLKGRCRKCHKKISLRYPAIELSTGLSFVVIFFIVVNCAAALQAGFFRGTASCGWVLNLGISTLPFLLLVASSLVAIFVIDLERQIIPDSLVFFLFLITIFALLLTSSPTLFTSLATGFGAALFLLLVNLVTRGRGMGLGDVKFALFAGTLVGWPQVLVWLYGAFIIGAVVGLTLIALGKAKFGKHIPFGPFLVVSLFITLIWGNSLANLLLFLIKP